MDSFAPTLSPMPTHHSLAQFTKPVSPFMRDCGLSFSSSTATWEGPLFHQIWI